MSDPVSIGSGNPFVAVGAALFRAWSSNNPGLGPGSNAYAFLTRIRDAARTPPPPAVDPNAPPPVSAPEAQFNAYNMMVIGRDTAAARRRRGSGPGYRPSWWKRLVERYLTYPECVEGEGGYTDTNVERCAAVFRPNAAAEAAAFPIPTRWPGRAPQRRRAPAPARRRQPRPRTPDRLPRIPAPGGPGTRVPRVLPYILRPIGLPAVLGGGILWPGRIEPDRPYEYPAPKAPTKGPPRRPVIRPPRRPVIAPGSPDSQPRPTEYRPPALPLPRDTTRPRPGVEPRPRPQPRPVPRPVSPPKAKPTPRPGAAPKWWSLPLMFPLPLSAPRVAPRPIVQPQPQPVSAPLTLIQPQPVALPETDPCRNAARRRKRKRDSCTNPITGRRVYTRGGRKYRTITRRLEC